MQTCFKHILLVNPGQSFTLLVNPSHFWSITSGRSFPCHVCNFWSILHTSNQSVTLLPVTSGQSLTLLGSILHRSIRVKMQSEIHPAHRSHHTNKIQCQHKNSADSVPNMLSGLQMTRPSHNTTPLSECCWPALAQQKVARHQFGARSA